MRIQIRIPHIVRNVCERVSQAGGASFLVGGAVIDALQGREPKDWDIEVFHLDFETLTELFADLGPNECGKAFGILKLSAAKCGGLDIDINVPRRDNKIGIGHRGFSVDFDPAMTPKEAARRRDFTINSMSVDIDTLELVDPFGGFADLKAGVLRATDPKTFVEDPLRALRAMQLLPRKAKTVDASTMLLIQSMADSFPDLPKERVHEEWRKLLLKAPKPSVGLEFLRESGWLKWFPELAALIGCEQRPEWHPEGDVWTHMLEVTDSAACVWNEVVPEWQEAFLFGAMLHDVGKPATTVTPEMVAAGLFPKERLLTAHGHDEAGTAPTESFLRRMTNNKTLIEQSKTIVREHMRPFQLCGSGAKEGAWKRLHGRIRLDVIGWVNRCDCCGRPDRDINDPNLDQEVAMSEECFARFDDLGAAPVQPILLGRHLLEVGIAPGPAMGAALRVAHEAQLDDSSLRREDLIALALQCLETKG